MNKIFKVIWSKSKQCYIVVSEIAKNKTGKKKIVVASILAALAMAGNMQSVDATIPEGNATGNDAFAIGPQSNVNGAFGFAIGNNAKFNSGTLGFAIGVNSEATSNQSIAIGYQSKAAGRNIGGGGDPALAVGAGAKATAGGATAIGMVANASNTFATAIGKSAAASGDSSIAIGQNTTATQEKAIAIGDGSQSTNRGSTALGRSSEATGASATALGSLAVANSTSATAVGMQSKATQADTVAIGSSATAAALNSIAMGKNATITAPTSGTTLGGQDSIAVGTRTSANQHSSVSIGLEAKSDGVRSIAIGPKASATDEDTIAIGSGGIGADKNNQAAGANGSSFNTSVAGLAVTNLYYGAKSTGKQSIAIGYTANAKESGIAFGNNAVSDGGGGTAMGKSVLSRNGGVVVGQSSYATGKNSVSYGNTSQASGETSIAVGYSTTAAGQNAVAVGYSISAAGKNSVSIGSTNQAKNEGSIAIGRNNNANQNNTVVIGRDSNALGNQSIAMGANATSKGTNDVAIGNEVTADGDNSVAIGRSATTKSTASLAIGSYGTKGTSATGAFSIAMGRDVTASAESAIAIGKDAISDKKNAVAIGSGADTSTAATAQSSTNIAGKSYSWSKGVLSGADLAGMQVSVGKSGAERQIKNVAAGEVSANSTDAINGSQLYAVASGLAKDLKVPYVSINSTASGTGSNVDNDGAKGSNSIAIGPSSTVTRQNGIAIGSGAQSLSEDSVVIGRDAKAETKTGAGLTTTSRAIVIGSNSRVAADVTQGVAIGSGLSPDEGAVVTGDQSIAIGGNVKVDGHSAIAIGGDDARKAANQLVSYTNKNDAEVTGTLQTAISDLTGYNLNDYKGTTASHAGVAYGASALAGNAGVAIGTAADSMTRKNDKGQVVNNKPVTNAVAIGTGARANFDNSVAIGGGSNTDRYATKQVNAIIDGVEVKWSGGENISPGDVVSFGAKGFERQLKNVAPGEVSQTSTDAINGSQIYSLARKVTNIMNGGAGSVVNVNASGQPLTKVVTGTGASKVEKYYRTVDVKDDGTLVNGAIAQTPTSLSLVNVDQTNVNQQTQVPRTLGNVADGVKDNDAVNVSQLNAAKVKYFSVNSTVTGNRDNTGATGVNAISIGPAATATKAQSIALGNSATAGGTDSIAIGNGSIAADKVAPVAIGQGAQANGDFSVALGGGNWQFKGAQANGVGTTALGTYSKTAADTSYQTVVGFGANTTKANATAIGYNSAVSTEGGVALGANSSSSTGRTVGYNPNDGRTNTYSALTGNVIRSTTGAVAVGNGTEVTRQITGVAAGTNDTDAVNVAQLKSVNLAFVGDSGFGDVNLANNDTSKRFAVKGDSTYLTTRANGNLITVSANKKDISVTNGTATAAAGMADAKNVAEAINKAVSQNAYTWNLTADNDTAGSRSTINKEGTVKFSGDQNITVARNGNTITSSLNKSIIVDSVKANNSVTAGSGSNQITLDGTTGAVTGKTFSGQSFTAGDNVLSNTTLQIGSPTNGNNLTITKDGLTSKAGTKTAKFGANGIDAGGQQITNVSSGGNVGTNAANITDVKNAVSDVTLKLDTNSKTGTVKLSESPLKVIGANGIRTDLVGTNNGSLVVGLDSNTVNATTKGIGLTGDTGFTGLKYLKDGDASFKVAGDGNLVTTKASATGVQVAVDSAKVKDLAVEAVTVSKANTADNPITVTPTAGTNSKDYAIGIDTTKLASKTDLTYRANNDTDANAQKVSLAKGLNFVNGDNTVSTVAADGKVSYDLNAATKTKIDDSATAVARNISLGADSGTSSSQSLKDGDVAFNVKGATGDYVSTNMNGNTVEVSTKRATINSDANNGTASVTGNDGLATAKNVADAINKAADAAKAGAAWNLTTNSSTTDKTSVQGGDTVDLINGDNIVITQDGTDKKKITVATKKDLTVDSVTAGNTVINTSGLTNGTTAITGSGITTDKVTVGGISIDKTDGINAGGKAISNVASGGTTDTNAANIGDVKQAVANLSQNLNITDGTNNGTVDLKNQKLNVAGANGVTATVNNQTITVGLDADTVNATTKGIGLTADTGTTGNKYLKDGDVSFAVTGDGNLVSTSATAAGVKVAVDAAKVKDLAVDAVTVSKDAQADNPITVTPTAGTNSKDYAIGIDTTKLAAKTDLTYRANNDTDANAKKVSLAKGLNFVNGTLTTASIDNDGVVKYDVNTAAITAGTDGTVTGPTTDGVATAQNVADAINAAKKASKTEITANTDEAANATTGNVILTSTTAADGHTIYDVKLNNKVTLGTGANAVTIDGTAGKATVGTAVVDGVNNTITTGGASPVTLDGATGTITGKTANIGGVTVNGTTNDITGLSNTTVTGADFATKGRAATEEQLKAVTSATALKFTGDVATNTGSINLKDDTFGIKGDGKYITTDVNGKDVNLTVSEAEIKKSAVAAVTVSTDTTDTNNPISVTPTTSADGTTKDYKVTIDGTKIANKTNLSYKANDGTAKQVSLADGLNFKNGTLTTASIDDAGVVKYDVNTAAITAGTDGTVTGPTTDGVATAQNVADAINAAKKASKTEITANTGEAANATTGNVTLTSTTAADGHTIYDVKLNDKVTLGTGANAVTIDGTAGKITAKNAAIGGVTVDGDNSHVTGLSNTTWNGTATTGRAATEDQLKAVADTAKATTDAVNLKFSGDTNTSAGVVNLKDDTFNIVGDGKYVTTDANGKDLTVKVSEAEVKKSAVAAVTVSTDTTDANNPISVTPTTSADGTTKDYKVTIDGTKIANKTNLSYKANDGTAKQVSLADGLNFKNGTLTTASIDDAGVVKYDVNTATITAGTDGTVTGPTTDGVATAQNVADAINAAKKASKTEITANTGEAANATTGNVTLTSTTAADGHTIYDVKLNDKVTLGTGANAVTIDGTAGKATIGSSVVDGVNNTITTGGANAVALNGAAGTVKTGTVTVSGGTTNDITGLSNTTVNSADFATKGRAATEEQLKAVGEQTWQITADKDATTSGAQTGTKKDAKVGKDDKVQLIAGENLTVNQNERDFTYSLNKDLVKMNSATFEATGGKTTVITGDSIAQTDGIKTNTSTAAGNTVVDGGKSTATTADGTTVTNGADSTATTAAGTTVTSANGNTNYAADGVRINTTGKNPVSLTDAGLDNGNNVIKNVASGHVNNDDTDNTNAANIADVKKATTTVTANNGEAANATTGNVTLTSTTAADGHTIYDVKLNDKVTLGTGANAVTIDGTAGKATIGSSVVDGVNNTITTGGANAVALDGAAGTVKTGTVTVTGGTTNDITGLSNTTVNSADFATKGRAATEEQLKAVGEQTWQITADKDATTSGAQTGTKKDAKVGKDDKVQLIAGENLTVNQNERDFTYSLNKDLVKMNSATFEATGGKTTVITGDSIAQTDGTKTNRSTAAGNTVADGTKSTETTAAGQVIKDGAKTNTSTVDENTLVDGAKSNKTTVDSNVIDDGNGNVNTSNATSNTIANGANSTATTAAGTTVTSANGNTNYAADGVRINTTGKNPVSLTDAGLDNGNNVIKNVASGHVNNDDTDNTNAANIADVKKATTTVTANNGEAANATTGNVTLTSTTAADGHTIYDVKLNDKVTLGTGANAVTIDGTAGKATVGTAVVDGVNNTITTGGANAVKLDGAAGTVKTGTVTVTGGTSNDITGLSNTTVNSADFATKGRAATEEQLKAVGEQTWQITADKDAATSGAQTGTKKDAKVGKDDKVQLIAGENLTVNQNERDFTYSLNKDLVKMNSATFEATGGKTTVITGDSIAQTDGTKTNRSTAAGNTVADGTKSTETTAAGQVIKDGAKTNTSTVDENTLVDGAKSNKTTVDSNVIDDGNGNVNTSKATSNTITDGTNTTEATASTVTVKDNAGNSTVITKDTITTGTGANKVTVDGTVGKVTAGSAVVDGVNNTFTTGGANAVALDGAAGTVKTGTVTVTGGTTNDITGLSNTTVTAADFATKGRAATEEQLKAVGEQTWQITADKDATTSGNQTGTKKDAKVGKDDKVQLIAGENLTVNQNERDFTYSLNKDLVKMNSATFEATGGKTTVITGDSIAQTDGTKTNTSTAAGNTVADGANSTATTAAGTTVTSANGNTNYAADGVRINTTGKNPVSLTDAGLDNGNNVIKNVASGHVNNDDTDNTNAANIADVKKATTTVTANNGEAANATTGNVTLTSTTAADGHTIYDVKLKDTVTLGTGTNAVTIDGTAGKVTAGSAVVDGVNNTITTGGANAVVLNGADGTVKTGTVTVTGGTTNDITGLSNTTVNSADFATKGRAATEEQLKQVGEQTWQITADKDAATSGAQTGTKKDAKVGKDDKVQLIAGENLTVNQNERDFTYSLNKDLVKMNSATFEATGGKTTVITGDSIAQTDGIKTNTSTAAGNTVVDGGKSTATTADGTTVTNGADSTATTAAGTTVTSANGNTNYAADGVRINTTGKNPVSLTDAGLDNGNNVIKNVASGHVNNDDTDNTNAANIADVKKATTTVTANNGEAANATTGNVTLTSTTAADGHTIYDVKLNDKVTLGTGANAVTIDGTAGKATIGSSVVDGVNNTITTGGANAVTLDGAAGTVKTGTVTITGGTTNDITGLSNTTVNSADFATKGRAATEEQLKQVGEQTWQITADKDAATSGNQTGTKKDAKVGKDDKVQLIAGENLTVNQNERDFTYSLNKDLVKMNSATFEATGGKTTVITGDSIAQTDGTKTNRSTAAGNTVADGTKSTETTAAGQVIKDGAKTNTSTVDENTLVDGAKSNKTTVDSNVIDDGNGNVNTSKATSNTITDGTNTTEATASTVTVKDNAGNSTVITKDTITTGTGANKVTVDGTVGKVTAGSAVVDGVNNTITTGGANAVKLDGAAGTVKTGTVTVTGGTTNDITGLSNTTVNSADFATKGRAATEEQLKQVGEQTWQITADKDAATSGNQTGTKKDAKVGKDDKVQLIAGENLTVNQNERDFTYSLNKDLVKMNSATFEATGGKTTVITGDSIAQTDGTKTNRSTAAGNTITDGTNTTEATASTVTVKDNAGNSTVITKDTITTGTGANKVTVDGTVGKVTAGSAVVDGVNNTITTGGANTVKLDGAAGTVTGLTNTAWTPGVTKAVSGRAATEDQLQQVSDAVGAGWNINSGTVAGSTGEANGSAKTKISSGEEVQLQAGNNLIIDQNGKTLAYSLNKNLKDMESAIFNAAGGKTTVIKGDSIVQTDGGKTNTSNAAGNTVVDGTKSTATTAAGTTITDGAKTNTNTADKNVIDDGAGNTNTSNATSNTIVDPNGNTNTATATSNTLADNAGNSNVSNATSNNLTDNAGNSNVSNATSNTLKNAAGDETKVDAKGATVKDAAGNTTNVAATGATVTNAAGDTTKVEATGTTVADAAGNKATFTKDGVTITKPGKDTVSLTGNGLDNGNNKIVNVADGTNDTDAVNVRQLDAKTKAATTELTANGGESAGNTTGNIVLTKTTAPDGHIVYDNKLNDKITLGAADPTKTITVDGTNGTIKAGKDGNAVAINGTDGTIKAGDGTNAVAIDGVNGSVKVADKIALNGKDGKAAIGTVGIDGKDGIITTGGNNPVAVNGKDGVVTGLTNKTWDPNNITSGRAATEDQVQSAVANAGWDATVGTEGSGVNSTPSAAPEKIRPNETLTFKAGNNMMVSHAGKTISYAVNPELTDMKSATFKDAAGNTTVTNGNGITIAPGSANPNNPNAGPVSLTKDGLNNGNNQIKGVAPGSDDTDAVNIGQLKASNAKMGDAIGQVAGEVQRVGAHAAAMAALKPIQYDPLEPTQIMAGVGNYRGETAAALGLAHYTNEDTMFNVGVSVGGNHNMVNAGVTHKFGSSPEKKNIPDRYKAGPISSVYVMQDEVSSLKKENAEQKYVIADQAARLNTLEAENERQRQELAETKQGLDDLRAAVDKLLASKG